MLPVLEKKKEELQILTKLDKAIERPFNIAPVQYHADNKALISVQNVMDNGAACLEDPHGMIVGAYNGVPIYQDVETHGNVIGNTGSGKTAASATTNLLSYAGSVVSLEIGGATIKRTYNHRKWTLGQDTHWTHYRTSCAMSFPKCRALQRLRWHSSPHRPWPRSRLLRKPMWMLSELIN